MRIKENIKNMLNLSTTDKADWLLKSNIIAGVKNDFYKLAL